MAGLEFVRAGGTSTPQFSTKDEGSNVCVKKVIVFRILKTKLLISKSIALQPGRLS